MSGWNSYRPGLWWTLILVMRISGNIVTIPIVKFPLISWPFAHFKFPNGTVKFNNAKFGKGDVFKNFFHTAHQIWQGECVPSGTKPPLARGGSVLRTRVGACHQIWQGGCGLPGGRRLWRGECELRRISEMPKTKFGEGNVSFGYATFGKGDVFFFNTTFGKGQVRLPIERRL